MNTVVLLPLPCGCIVDYRTPLACVGGYVECPWCEATFALHEVGEWISCQAWPFGILGLCLGQTSFPLLRFAGLLVEPRGVCGGCGTPEYRQAGQSIDFHLAVLPNLLERVRN